MCLGGPTIIETTFNSLLSTRDNPTFLISFNVTNGIIYRKLNTLLSTGK